MFKFLTSCAAPRIQAPEPRTGSRFYTTPVTKNEHHTPTIQPTNAKAHR